MSLINFSSAPAVSDFIREMRISYRERKIPTILDESLNALLLMVSVKRPNKILEIGTATGMSGIAMLDAVKSASLTTIEKDEDSFAEAKANFERCNLSHRVRQFCGDAGDIINYIDGKFDFIFLDGSKARYYDYLSDVKRLLAESGVLFADNVLFRGYVDGSRKFSHGNNTIVRNMRAFITELTESGDFITQVLNIGDGILISYKK